MKTKISVRALLAAAVLTTSPSLPQAFAADEVQAAAKAVNIDASKLSPELLDVAKLVQSGVDEKIIAAYVQKSPLQRAPTADELLYLRELGLSNQGMLALLNSAKAQVAQSSPTPSVQSTTPPTSTAPATQTTASPQVIYTPPPVVYAPPPAVYYEPAWSYPVFSFGLDLGHHVFDHHVFGHHNFGHFGGHHGGHH